MRSLLQPNPVPGPGWQAGSTGTSRVWDEATRARKRVQGSAHPAPSDAALPHASETLVDETRLRRALAQALLEHAPDLPADRQEALAASVRSALLEALDPSSERRAQAQDAALSPGAAGTQTVEQRTPAPPPTPELAALPRFRTRGLVPRETQDELRQALAQLGGPSESLRGLRRDVLALVLATATSQATARLQRDHAPGFERIDNLRRRTRKMRASLRTVREALAQVDTLPVFDDGLASIYRTVQGLSTGEEDAAKKREMLSQIFDANVALFEELRERRSA